MPYQNRMAIFGKKDTKRGPKKEFPSADSPVARFAESLPALRESRQARSLLSSTMQDTEAPLQQPATYDDSTQPEHNHTDKQDA